MDCRTRPPISWREFLTASGKRLRPLLCVTGWHAASGTLATPPASLVRAAAALETFHAFALVHDDGMDDSATRRGRPPSIANSPPSTRIGSVPRACRRRRSHGV
ncbi:polyprenyl synthetase family protein [Streptomyces sp. NBC_01017]|uniref:polyprenyl synthetase family protein n=1 Tax=Streptomyces sp. NBC_01017 TaxID=2903721 RepID=UPI00386ECC4B